MTFLLDQSMAAEKIIGKSRIENAIGESIDFDKFISQLKGKIIFVDFWASWCVRCRQALPQSHK